MKACRAVFLGVIAITFGVSIAAKSTKPIRVFVFTSTTNPSGFVDLDAKQREDSVGDLKKALAKKVEIVDDKKDADVVIEIISRAGKQTGSVVTERDGLGRTYGDAEVVADVHVSLKAGDYSTFLDGYSARGQIFRVWTDAANNVASLIDKWINENQARLLELRKDHK